MQNLECLAVIQVRARPDEVNRSGLLLSSAQRGKATSRGFPRHLHRKSVRYRQCADLIRFQGNLLSKHDIAREQTTCGHETPANERMTIVIDLVDVRSGTVADAVSLAAVATDDITISFGIKLRAFP